MQQIKMLFKTLRGGDKMNTGAFIHDLLGWIDNNLDSRLDIDTVSGEPAIPNGTCSGYSKSIPAILSPSIFARKSCKNRLSV